MNFRNIIYNAVMTDFRKYVPKETPNTHHIEYLIETMLALANWWKDL